MNQKNKKEAFFTYPPFSAKPEWVPVAKRIRARFGNKFIADSLRVMLKRGFPLWYFFPRYDIDMELLEKSREETENDKWGSIIKWNLKAGGKTAKNAARSYENPSENAPENIDRYIAFNWDAIDSWFEEDEEVRVHPRDPYHRIDSCRSSRHVRIIVDDETVAESRCPVVLFETGLPARFYIPKTDVWTNFLEPTNHKTHCPYKGTASYYSVKTDKTELKNVVWTYPYPNAGVQEIQNLLAFYTEKIDEVYVDGVRMPKETMD